MLGLSGISFLAMATGGAFEFNLTSVEQLSLWSVVVVALLALVYGAVLAVQILRKERGTANMQKVALAIQEGANAYLRRQLTTVAFLVVILAAVIFGTAYSLGTNIAVGRTIAFLIGAVFSAAIGFLGMGLAVRANLRTAAASFKGFNQALSISFRSGVTTGMFTVGLGLLGPAAILLIYEGDAPEVLIGLGFGAALLALLMRVGGGIFTKAADVGADLVGKVEAGIPEDDPRNPAVIADNVGDNVGDCAGMAADLFESYEVTLVGSMILGYAVLKSPIGVLFPLLVMAVGVIASIIGSWFVRTKKQDALGAMNFGFAIAALIAAAAVANLSFYFMGAQMEAFWATAFGLILAAVILLVTQYYTATQFKPVKEIAFSARSGPATTILTGIAVGKESTVVAVVAIALAVMGAVFLSDGEAGKALYYVALAGLGILTTTGMIVSMDNFGPVADNAGGIVEMSRDGNDEAQEVIDKLDAVGNTTKAVTKGLAIASAVIAAISLFGSFIEIAGLKNGIRVDVPQVFVGLLIGAAVPFLFSALTIRAVGRGATAVVEEVRRQFREIKGIMEGTGKPDYASITDICTKTALKELIAPGLLAVLMPVVIGFSLKEAALGGFLAGVIVTGQLLAVYLSTAGGAWDNAKKWIEDGNLGGKGSDIHKAAVIGDTVGDPFKDTSGPALNPLLKVMNLISLLIVPLVVKPELATTGYWVAAAALAIVVGAVLLSKREALPEVEAVPERQPEVAS
ncbi:MAG: sodium-translocating pyrophosphatase [Actinobacteria bacterium]|nr:sodium-translocating pyrophosphatase [Actinomycetota bacterium]